MNGQIALNEHILPGEFGQHAHVMGTLPLEGLELGLKPSSSAVMMMVMTTGSQMLCMRGK